MTSTATTTELAIVGYHVPKGYVCMDPACIAFYIDTLGAPIHEGDEATDEGHYLSCSSCTETLDEKAELRDWLRAPIPMPASVYARARELGVIAK